MKNGIMIESINGIDMNGNPISYRINRRVEEITLEILNQTMNDFPDVKLNNPNLLGNNLMRGLVIKTTFYNYIFDGSIWKEQLIQIKLDNCMLTPKNRSEAEYLLMERKRIASDYSIYK